MSSRRNIRRKAPSESDDEGYSLNKDNSLNKSNPITNLSFIEDISLSTTKEDRTRPRRRESPKHAPTVSNKKVQEAHPRVSACGGIPNSSEIHVARKNRLQARESEKTRGSAHQQGNDCDEEVHVIESEDDWEEQQIRKGVSGMVSKRAEEEVIQEPTIPPMWVGNGNDILDSLKLKLAEINERTAVDNSQGIEDSLDTGLDRLEVLKGRRPQLESSYLFYQSMRQYILTVVDCIQDKISDIDHVLGETLVGFKEGMRMVEIIGQSRTLFDDAAIEYCTIPEICSMFGRWKNSYRESYEQAYAGLCLCKLLTPFVRLEMIDWNPLRDLSYKLEDFPWFKSLIKYSLDESAGLDQRDSDVLALVVERAVLSRLSDIVAAVWDPRCFQSTFNLGEIIKHLFSRYPIPVPDSMEAQRLFGIIKKKVEDSLQLSIPLYSAEILDQRQSPEAVYFYDSLWGAVNLFNSLSCLSHVVSVSFKARWAGALLNGCILVALRRLSLTQEVVQICWELLSTLKVISLEYELIRGFAELCSNLVIQIEEAKFEDYRTVQYKFVCILKEIGAVALSDMLGDILAVE